MTTPIFQLTNDFPSYTPKCEIRNLEQFVKSPNCDLSKPHHHNYYILVWVTNGNGCHSVDFIDNEFSTNTVLLISPGQIHYFKKCHNVKGWAVCFQDDSFLLDDSKDNNLIKCRAYELFDSATTIHVDADPDKITQLFLCLQEELQRTDKYAHYDMIICLLKILLIQITRYSHVTHQDAHDVNHSRGWDSFNRFRRILELNYQKVHTVSEYAKLVGISARSLANITHEVVGAHPLKIINCRIVLEAKRQLAYSSKPIKEIAFSLGFKSMSHFTKTFNAQAGTSPLEFRAEHQTEGVYPLDSD